ncbi:3-hydroxyacyl-CoA dehydrogenase NAD-binding domain-containing protein [Cellulomonas carbonis]|uniref:3-hydroxyacyl-CoA dehydrogenase n=1 Tax=Cellulomonas carbonis T26 TaxID=947969 RepID=A0A0A0BXA1_9CELL|nr:3-hydroxyacyl-CoA dehydrogenase NAD-binding domain-containing protein [Cellulomonas carbonis]KGM12556.1 3-hydroxyacyl-CoA dehydrogenase [Cellulomonas carbonis T26]GGB93481.1 3-hydroxyacyl-CoA dehydrogenase [Cellulomonas carbonis]
MTATTTTWSGTAAAEDVGRLTAATADVERVTHAPVRDVVLPGGAGTLALVTLDNGLDHTKPTTLGPNGLAEIAATLRAQQARAAAGEIVAVAVTGKPYYLAAGADLRIMGRLTSVDDARTIARMGHDTYRLLRDMGVPTFAFVNGAALGGGLEIALACSYRTVSADVSALALPETYLGLVPGWGGCYHLPRLVGVEAAVDLILTRPLANNRRTDAATAARIGLVDVALHPADFLEQSLAWASRVLTGEVEVARRPLDDAATWDAVVGAARAQLDRRLHGSRRAPYAALELVAAARESDVDTAFAAEDEALTDLLMTDELRAGLYAFDLVTRRSRKPTGAPDRSLARPVRSVGIVGAGLMARQLAVLVARRLRVPVLMTEVDDERVAAGLEGIRSMVAQMAAKGRMSEAEANRVVGSITVSTDIGTLAGVDLAIEAVTEVMGVKQQVFSALEKVLDPEAVLATNTSALSVAEMSAHLDHPERVVGLHFFNPVAQMPLVEVVRAERSSDAAVATAFAVAEQLRKTAVGVADRPGFVVNRLLLRMLAEVAAAVEAGTPVEVADRALRPLGLPMGPFALIQLVGLPVALHVLRSLHEDLGDRYPLSPGLERLAAEGRRVVPEPDGSGREQDVDPAIQEVFGEPGGPGALDEAGVLDAVLAGLAEEVGLMLDERVVAEPEQIDLCMVLGAGWPLHLGGITPHLDRSGHAERVIGRRLHEPGVASLA